ncbi:hypothetical protein F3Y22_tig00112159pilonHSYRG00313 [Hibiscus syriacus]|uniref:DUF4378 domain-containing protein n=1 Tax=Hibiscus syriacus TaxID=106335 RepID=A0A6A2YDM7_HIBSY|nr:hypothetical protein F3Y22_tig00112159pilonHSYRG00313 [Hibiscus syriacus]
MGLGSLPDSSSAGDAHLGAGITGGSENSVRISSLKDPTSPWWKNPYMVMEPAPWKHADGTHKPPLKHVNVPSDTPNYSPLAYSEVMKRLKYSVALKQRLQALRATGFQTVKEEAGSDSVGTYPYTFSEDRAAVTEAYVTPDGEVNHRRLRRISVGRSNQHDFQPHSSNPYEIQPSSSYPYEIQPSSSNPYEIQPSSSYPYEIQPSSSYPYEIQPSSSYHMRFNRVPAIHMSYPYEIQPNSTEFNPKLTRLNSTHDEASTDYIASLCENTNQDHRYISEILLASGLLLRNQGCVSTAFQLHPSAHPINPELFFVLEKTKASSLLSKEDGNSGKVSLSKPDHEKFHRKFIFDLVNEILVGKLALVGVSAEPWMNSGKLARKTLNAKKLLKELCTEIEHFQAKKSNSITDEEEDGLTNMLLEDVMCQSESWTGFNGGISRVVLDVERMVFKDLVSEF